MRRRRIGFLLHRLLQNRTLQLCALAAVTAVAVAACWNEHSVSAQTASPPITVTTTQLGISPGAPMPAESSEPAPVVTRPEAAGPRTPLAKDSEDLLKLADSLQADMNKTTKDMLSVSVVREAGEIEQLAHRMRTR